MLFSINDIPKNHHPKIGKAINYTLYREGEITSLSISPIIVKTKSKQPRTIAVKKTILFYRG